MTSTRRCAGRRTASDWPSTWRNGTDYRDKKIYLINLDGTGLREFGEEANCDWSPDDKQIVCSVYAGHREREGVYVQNVDGGGRDSSSMAAAHAGTPMATKLPLPIGER